MVNKIFLQILFSMLVGFWSFTLLAQREVAIHMLSEIPVIDGIHDVSVWEGAVPATGLIQMEPGVGEPATLHSEFYIGQDKENLYLSAILYQRTKVNASIQSRDQLSKSDDCIVLVLDSYNDKRSGYGFWINPLGTQVDFRINDDGNNIDTNWDTEWESAVSVADDRWVVEIKLPFSSIRYNRNIAEWGVNLGRIIRDNFETSFWSGIMTEDFRISQGGTLSGIKAPERKAKLTLFPYATLRYENNDFNGVHKNIRPDAGTDIKWKINPNITADATLNPDFATVEADQEQVNLTRYELSYPEKRLFFQEGNEMYDTRIKTFYSRRIQDVFYGAKVNGKAGKYNFNAMNVRTLQPSMEDELPSFFSTVRVKRDFLESSSLGFSAVDKRNDSSYVTTFSGDYNLNLGKKWKLTGQLVASLPGDFASHSAWFVRFANESNIHHVHFRYSEFGENFMENVNQTGFVRDDNRREMDTDLTYLWWLNNPVLRYVEFTSRSNAFWSRSNGDLRSWYFTEGIEFYMENRISFEYMYNNEFKLFEKEYFNHRHMFELGYNTAEWNQVSLEYSRGYNFDRNFNRIEFDGQVKLTEKMALGYAGDYVNFNPDTTNSTTFINVLNLNYNFTKDLWVEVFGQTRSNTGKFYLYGKVGWRFRPPFGALYLIYTHDQDMVMDERLDADLFFIKLTLPISVMK